MFSRAFFFLAVAWGLVGCGFQPLYGGKAGEEVDERLSAIQIAPMRDRLGQRIHNLLLDRLNSEGRPSSSKFTLNLAASVSTAELGLRFTEVATRAKLTLIASYYLTDDRTGDVLSEGIVRSVNSYNIPSSEYARITSEADATERAAREVSDEIRVRLGLFFRNNPS